MTNLVEALQPESREASPDSGRSFVNKVDIISF